MYLIPLIAMTGMWLFLRKIGYQNMLSVGGAILFAYSSTLTPWMVENPAVGHTIVYIPILLWAAELLHRKVTSIHFFISTIAWMLLLTAGHLQFALYAIAFCLLYSYAITKRVGDGKRQFIIHFFSFVISVFLAAPQLLPTVENYRFSPREEARNSSVITDHILPWAHIISLLIPDYGGNPGTYNYRGKDGYYDKAAPLGPVVLPFLILGIFGKKSRRIRFFTTSFIVSLVLAFDWPITRFLYTSSVPVLSSMLPSRILIITSFSLTVKASL
jgi:hypothetical protein